VKQHGDVLVTVDQGSYQFFSIIKANFCFTSSLDKPQHIKKGNKAGKAAHGKVGVWLILKRKLE